MKPSPTRLRLFKFLLVLALAMASSHASAATWWNKEWTIRKKIVVNAGDTITEPLASATVLLRLHGGNFSFTSAKDDGSDIRLVADDDKTPLPFHIEKIDPLLNEAFVWVKVPDLKPGAPRTFWLYYGNANAANAGDPKTSFDADTIAVYHFAEHSSAPADSTTNANNALAAGLAADGTIIGTGLRLDGRTIVKLPASASLKWNAGAALTWSAWLKLAALPPNGVLFSRREGANAFIIGVDGGVPFVEIASADGTQRTSAGAPLAAGAWRHLAVVATPEKITLFLDGESYATLNAALPALNSEAALGGDADEIGTRPGALSGEFDELEISKIARSASALKFAAVSQGTSDKAAKLIAIGNDEESANAAEGEISKHFSLISDISKSLTPDGWIVIALCAILALVGGFVTLLKFFYISKITRASNTFLKQWTNLSADLSVLDHSDVQSVKSLGGRATSQAQKAMRPSPLYHLYQLGFAEIQHRVVNARDGFRGLSGRTMQAIRAKLDGGREREVQRLNSKLVFLTIGIAGGPYLGLLGTVIGVMITFAVIAKSGAVEVNSIAPGIAGALLATVAGLAVAIPALFAYSYINTRISDAISDMEVFIDEFVAVIAEAYPEID